MTPTLTTIFLRRLMVTTKDTVVYDERYHAGVNIIRGEGNSVGKSTIANMIFYSLGGEGIRWIDEALECDAVIAEVELNGAVATLRRQISIDSMRPMQIFWGHLAEAINDRGAWREYPFAQRGRDGFSQVLFRALGIPEFRGDLGSTLTMHQFLRLIFVDQKSAQDTIFRFEKFDSASRREMIGEILCGFFDPVIYEKEEQLRKMAVEFDELKSESKSLRNILRETGQFDSVDKINRQIAKSTRERGELDEQLDRLRQDKVTPKRLDRIREDLRLQIENELRSSKQELLKITQERENIGLEIDDSNLFLDSLRRKAEALKDSTAVLNELGRIDFEFCPSCYMKLDPLSPGSCRLCKRILSQEQTQSQIFRARQELAQQLRESRDLQEMRKRRLSNLTAVIPSLTSHVTGLSRQYSETMSSVTTVSDQVGAELARKKGYLDRELEDLREQLRVMSLLVDKEDRLRSLSNEIQTLQAQVRTMREVQTLRRAEATQAIEEAVKYLLEHDIGDEESFRDPHDIRFDFGADSVHVNNRRNFSDSSLVYLKNSFHLGIFFSSLTKSFMRYPRFVLFDNIEDKGMVPARSQNFQRLIVAMSDRFEEQHQIIFTTSMIDEGLNKTLLPVGPCYTRNLKSLKIPHGGNAVGDKG